VEDKFYRQNCHLTARPLVAQHVEGLFPSLGVGGSKVAERTELPSWRSVLSFGKHNRLTTVGCCIRVFRMATTVAHLDQERTSVFARQEPRARWSGQFNVFVR
jgi:hypothetical protein